MAEEKNVFTEFEAEKEKIKKEAYGYAGKKDEEKTPPPADDGNSSDKDDNNPPAYEDNTNDNNTSPKPARAPDGESHAYDDIDLNQMGKPQKEASSTKAPKNDSWPKAPERKKPGKGGDAKDIMELFWKECILAFYDWVIDTTIDTVLDFADWVLYKPFSRDAKEPQKAKEPQNKTAFDLGDELIAKYSQNATKGKELFDQAHKEILENVNKSRNNMTPEWKVWQSEPPFFAKVLDLANKAAQNPNSPEATAYTRFQRAPEIMDSMLKKEILLRKMSVGLSTIDEVLNAKDKTLPSKVLSEIAVMKKNLKNKKTAKDLKDSLKKQLNTITPLLSDDNPVHKVALEKISAITQIVSSPETDLGILTASIGKNLDEIKNGNPPQTNIENTSKGYYEDLMSNIDKIQKAYANDPGKAQTVIRDYMFSVAEAIKTAKKQTDTYMSSSIVTAKKHKKEAQSSLNRAVASINNFIVDGARIGDKPKDAAQAQSPLTGDKYRIFNAVKDYGLGA